MKNNFKVDFIGIGAAKSGTTWLADMLRQHHKIFIPMRKELHYFEKEFNEDPKVRNEYYYKPNEWYASFFKSAKKNQIKGEFTASYMCGRNSAHDIYKFNPNIRIIAILRNPIDRAYSDYLFNIQKGIIDNISFRDAIKKKRYLIDRSLYYKQLKRFFDIFPSKNIKVMFYEDLVKNKKKFLKEIEIFLGVYKFIPKNIEDKSNVTGAPKYPLYNKVISKGRQFLKKNHIEFVLNFLRVTGIARVLENVREDTLPFDSKPNIDKELRDELLEFFRPDVKKLEKLLHKDLSHWK